MAIRLDVKTEHRFRRVGFYIDSNDDRWEVGEGRWEIIIIDFLADFQKNRGKQSSYCLPLQIETEIV